MNRGRPRHEDILTPREWEVLRLIEQGLTNEQIAERLGISFGTAKYHVGEIISKLGVERREEAPAAANRTRVPVPALLPFGWLRGRFAVPALGAVAAAALLLALSVVVFTDVLNDGTATSPQGDLSQAAADFVNDTGSSAPSYLGRRDTVSSMEMTMTSKSYYLAGEQEGEAASAFSASLWYEAPQLMRLEAGGRTSVWDGLEFWQYDPERNWAAVVPQDPNRDIFTHAHAWMARWVDDLDAFLNDSGCRTANVIGEANVAGRDAHVFELSRRSCGAPYPGSDGRQVLWVDQATGLILKHESYTIDGRLAHATEVVSIEYDVAIDPDRFVFQPPADAEIQDSRDQPRGVLYESDDIPPPAYLTLDEARQAATFPLLAPAFVPAGFELETIEHQWSSEGAREHQSHADTVLFRYVDAQGNWLVIGQGFPGARVAAAGEPPAAYTGTVDINGSEATWIDGWPTTDEVWQPGIRTALYWEAGRLGDGWEVSPDGKKVTTGSPLSVGLASNVLTLQDLVSVAESLR